MKEISSLKMTRGHRTFFFDINKSKNGNLYLKISESKKTASGFEHHRLIIFEEDMEGFFKTFQKTLEDFNMLKSKNQADRKKPSTTNTSQKAYGRWSQQEDDKLEILFCEGKKTKELSEIFARNTGAINSRIKKLELREKYGRRA
ncbi:DUF3276 family protein [Flavobacterium sp. MAH-1]|uniref:DUF3276 family protein n=1 Tax=Flavobacterium agri TaxID=2743471 RepID=A0A7Y8XZB8_9FLAO|nr:DUF3276 family protein [Flavobacterium agri]NUY79689.1 DUF3276 family protein [Flavobacterium agri]NYA69714.1 DUF3276 family protein [Flavobacterium agri]